MLMTTSTKGTEMFTKPDQSERQESAFYHTADLGPETVWDGNERFYVERCGEMLIVYTDDEGEQHILRNTRDLEELGIYTDEALAGYTEKGEDKFTWKFNSWFEIWDDNEQIYLEGEVWHELDEAVERAIHLYQISIGEGK
jgi:hypothetical protein